MSAAFVGTERLEALHGRLRLRIVAPPGTVVGRSESAGLRVVGDDAEHVSREHLVLATAGPQWVVADKGSTNGTSEEAAERATGASWQPLPSYPIPVYNGMHLLLGRALTLHIEILMPPLAGTLTPQMQGATRGHAQRIAPHELERIAAALVAHKRPGARGSRPTTAEGLAGAFYMSRQNMYRRLDALRELPEIKPLVTDTRTDSLAEAVAAAFPYLIAEPGP